uniref:C-type lectin domain-containing protein n=1 Tax=Stegastes partitus TaxID=144197 RepID=A0A3B4Z2N4_9TELE
VLGCLSLSVALGTSSSQRCPPDWREIQSKCYFLSTEMKTWEDSRKYCQRNGSDLVVINSQQEQVLCSSSALVDMYLLFWIGLKGTNRVFRWVDGSEFVLWKCPLNNPLHWLQWPLKLFNMTVYLP